MTDICIIFDHEECCVFFFQAEDGIRDLVRSRGLGDVYKRQVMISTALFWVMVPLVPAIVNVVFNPVLAPLRFKTVSYTHLTLPTSDLV